MLLKIHPTHPESRKINHAVDALTSGGVMIYPTDSVYALGCDLEQRNAANRICRLRGLNPGEANLTLMCQDISQVSAFAQQMNNATFRLMKRNLPGPFTFIMNANNKIPKMFHNKRRTIGVRIPDARIAQTLIETLGRPVLSISLKTEDEDIEYFTDPSFIYEKMGKLVDVVVSGEVGRHTPSTIVDVTGDEPKVLRQGAGELLW